MIPGTHPRFAVWISGISLLWYAALTPFLFQLFYTAGMTDNEHLDRAYKSAINKFNAYIKSVYALLEMKNELTIYNRDEARKAWKNSVKQYENQKLLIKKTGRRECDPQNDSKGK